MKDAELELKIEIGVLEADIKVVKQRVAKAQNEWILAADKRYEEKRELARLEAKLNTLKALT